MIAFSSDALICKSENEVGATLAGAAYGFSEEGAAMSNWAPYLSNQTNGSDKGIAMALKLPCFETELEFSTV